MTTFIFLTGRGVISRDIGNRGRMVLRGSVDDQSCQWLTIWRLPRVSSRMLRGSPFVQTAVTISRRNPLRSLDTTITTATGIVGGMLLVLRGGCRVTIVATPSTNRHVISKNGITTSVIGSVPQRLEDRIHRQRTISNLLRGTRSGHDRVGHRSPSTSCW